MVELNFIEVLTIEMMEVYLEDLDRDTTREKAIGLYRAICEQSPDYSEDQLNQLELEFANRACGMDTNAIKDYVFNLWQQMIVESAEIYSETNNVRDIE